MLMPPAGLEVVAVSVKAGGCRAGCHGGERRRFGSDGELVNRSGIRRSRSFYL